MNVKNNLAGLVIGTALLVVAYLSWKSLAAWSQAPIVDGWPVYNRIMMWLNGEVGLSQYLLQPHGSHPHTVVYALYLIDLLFGARQIIPHLVSVFCACVTAIIVASVVFVSNVRTTNDRLLAAFGFAFAAIAVASVSTEMLTPFQVVLTASRLAYVAAILGAVHYVKGNRPVAGILLLAASCIFVTFHGSGLIFAVVLVLIHLALPCSWWIRMLSTAPLISYLAWSKIWLPPGAGELAGLSSWVANVTIQGVAGVVLGAIAYYGTPLISLLPDPANYWPLLLVGACVAITSVGWSVYVIVYAKRHGALQVALAFLSIFVALSAASAALIWEVRSTLGGDLDPVYAIVTTQRYSAGALLAYALLPVPLFALFKRWSSLSMVLVVVCASVLFVSSTRMLTQREDVTNLSNIAATALVAGADITEAPASALWPGVSVDWYWPTQLKKLFSFMQDHRLGFSYNLSRVGTPVSEPWRAPITDVAIQATAVENVCSLAGRIPPLLQHELAFHDRLLSVSTPDGLAVGAVAILTDKSTVKGHVECAGVGSAQLYASHPSQGS